MKPQLKPKPSSALAVGQVLTIGLFAAIAEVATPPTSVSPTTPPIGESTPPRPLPPEASLGNPAADPLPLRAVAPGIFQIGDVTLDKERRTVWFPAVINMNQGPMEYLLVTTHGKVHESILRTPARADHLHVAMLLLDAKAAAPGPVADPAKPKVGSPNIDKPGSETLPGDPLNIEVSWNWDGKETTRNAAELVSNLQTKVPMEKGNWVYNGSEFVNGIFQAQVTGSLASLITDRQCLINNVGKGHDNDDIWAVNTNGLPPVNTPVRVMLRLASKSPTN